MGYIDRVAERALKIKPMRLLLSLLALPFYIVGAVLGLLLVLVLFAWSAVQTGIVDMRNQVGKTSEAGGTGAD